MNDPVTLPTPEEVLQELTRPGQLYELENLELQGRPCRVFKKAPATLRDVLMDARKFGDLDFVVYGDERLSFVQFYDEVARLAQRLVSEFGVSKGDRVAIGMRNYPEWSTAFMAIVAIGGIPVALNALWNGEELAYALELTGAHLVIADGERVARLEDQLEALDLRVLAVRCEPADNPRISAARMGAASDDAPDLPPVELAPDDDSMIFFTSGSSGHPKAAVSSHRAPISSLLSWNLDRARGFLGAGMEVPNEPWEVQHKYLVGVPLFHVSGSHAALLQALYSGRQLHLMYKWDVNLALDIIEREQIDNFVAVPTMTGDLVQAASAQGRSLSSLAAIGGGGSARPAAQVRKLAATFTNAQAVSGWGMTETNAIGTGIGGEDYQQRPLSSGRCSQVMDLRVVDDEDQDVAPGEPGHLLVRGTAMFRGYWNQPEANKEAFVDGWFRTGDVAQIDEEGFLFIIDRAKDIVIRGGENIGCGAVEDAIYSHPDVEEVVVFGLPDERLGEIVACMVFAGAAELTQAQLQDYLSSQLATFQVPSQVFFTDQPLPRIASGKFDKRNIRTGVLKTLGLA